MNDPAAERRRFPRVNIQVEASMRLILPEQAFSPLPMQGCTKHISLGGLRFETRQTPEDYYKVIVQKTRHARISVFLPGTDDEISLFGRVVWTDLNTGQSPPLCRFGFNFEELGAKEQEALHRAINLLSQETAPGFLDQSVQNQPNGN